MGSDAGNAFFYTGRKFENIPARAIRLRCRGKCGAMTTSKLLPRQSELQWDDAHSRDVRPTYSRVFGADAKHEP
jgi:hypothetical protein